jgi:FkbM family methyltransferase|tara:strand:- start:451 stop:1140 length:690 start_codon:yes stop_codon:yes gene_type:complete
MDFFCKTKNGDFWVSDLDNSQSVELYYFKVWEQHLLDVIDKYVVEGTVAIDAGANFGSISVPISKKLGSSGKLYSFEMSKVMASRLKRNIEQNKCSNVELLNIALSDVADQSVFFGELEEDQKTNFGDIRINKEAEGTEVKTTTIDSLNIQDRVSFIKVDCQGYDLKVMRGAKETIEKHRPVVVFEWEDDMSSDFNDTIEDVLAFYSELNYKVNKIEKDDWIAIPNEVS